MKKFFDSLPTDCIWEINISRFKNLTILTVQYEVGLADKFIKDLAECEFLKKLKVCYTNFIALGKDIFLKMLVLDRALAAISDSKKLEYLNIPGCKSIKFAFTKICLLKNLIILNLTDTKFLGSKKAWTYKLWKVSKNHINVAHEIKYTRKYIVKG